MEKSKFLVFQTDADLSSGEINNLRNEIAKTVGPDVGVVISPDNFFSNIVLVDIPNNVVESIDFRLPAESQPFTLPVEPERAVPVLVAQWFAIALIISSILISCGLSHR